MMPTTVLIVLVVAFVSGILLMVPKLARPTLPFGVRVPESQVDAPVIRQATGQYRRSLIVTITAVTGLLVVLAQFLPPAVVITAAAVVPVAAWFVPHLSARRIVLAAKRTGGWYEGVRQAVVADTAMRTSPPPYPWRWAVPAVVIALTSIVVGIVVYPSLPDRIATRFSFDGPTQITETTVWSAFGLVGTQLLLTAMLMGIAVLALRSKADLVASAPEMSATQYREYASAMARSVLLLATGLNLTMLLVALMVWDIVSPTTAWLVLSIVPTLAATAVLVVYAIRAGQSGHRLEVAAQQSSGIEQRDDDAYWIAGVIYVNRDDPALWVPKRFGGVGWTINFARPAAWVLTAATLAVLIGAPIWAIALS